jgi:hypothetical protein
MAGSKGIRGAFEKELTKLKRSSGKVESRLRSASEHVATRAKELEKVVEKNVVPNVTAKLKAVEKELAAYVKASERGKGTREA